jgi:hypothetical protein
MGAKLTKPMVTTIKDAAEKLTGHYKRRFQAKVTLDYLEGSARRAETVFGWGREAVQRGLCEYHGLRQKPRTTPGPKRHQARGRRKTEQRLSRLKEDIRSLVESRSQVDPKFQSPFAYTRMTAAAVRKALIDEKGYDDEDLPCQQTIRRILNRLNFRLRRVQKTKPLKKIKETDAIFDNVARANREADEDPTVLRISCDAKAHLKIGEFTRGGRSRDANERKALDHDMKANARLIPFGILEVASTVFTIIFGTSRETSDFVVDCLQQWWDDRKVFFEHIRKLAINIDNGPQIASNRTQFIKRMVEFADQNNLEIELIYYPPYHSKYNPVERCWGILEMHWNGTLLDTVEKALGWAKTMTWKGTQPVVQMLEKAYQTGVRLTKAALKPLAERIRRSKTLPRWSASIQPQRPAVDPLCALA